MSVNSAERGLPVMAGRVLLIDNSTKHTERVRDLVSRTRLEVYTSGSAQDAIRHMHRFFTERLIAAGVDPETAEADACRIEHVISDESFQCLKSAKKTET